MLLQVLIFIGALGVLVKSTDILVKAVERIAQWYGVSQWVIGLTVVAIGTSIPELGTSIAAAVRGAPEIAVGTIIGSNITNIGLILGLASMIFIFPLKRGVYGRDIIILGCITTLFLILASDKIVSRGEGLVLVFLFVIYIYYRITKEPEHVQKKRNNLIKKLMKNEKKVHSMINCERLIQNGLDYRTLIRLKKQGINKYRACQQQVLGMIAKNGIIVIIGVLGIALGAKFMVSAAINIAKGVQVPSEMISLSAIAIGTSLPELAVTFVSARKKLGGLLVGNLVGSNIANILLVGGIGALITPLTMTRFDLWFGLPIALIMTLLFFRFTKMQWFSRVMEGMLLLCLYILFIIGIAIFFF